MKKLLMFILVAVMGVNVFAKKLYVGTNAEFPPYEYRENGKLAGFDIELMELIADKVGFEVVWKDLAFDGLIPALQTKKIDAIISGMAQTETRQKAVDFSNPYLFFDYGHSVISHKDSTLKSKDELKGKIVGVQLGSMQEEFAKDLGARVKLFSSFTGAVMEVQNNRIDAVIVSEEVGLGYLASTKNIKLVDKIQDKYPGASIAFRKGDPKFVAQVNQALEELKTSDEYAKIAKKYFPDKYETFIKQ